VLTGEYCGFVVLSDLSSDEGNWSAGFRKLLVYKDLAVNRLIETRQLGIEPGISLARHHFSAASDGGERL